MRMNQNFLVVNPFGIGDVLFMTPVLRMLATSGRAQRIDVILGSRTRALLESNPYVSQIYEVDKDAWHREGFGRVAADCLRLSSELARGRYGALIDFSLTREYAFWAKVALGIRTRVGFDWNGRGSFLTHRIPILSGFSIRHAAEWYADSLSAFGLSPTNLSLEVFIPDAARAEAQAFLKDQDIAEGEPFLAACAGGGESWGKDASMKRAPAALLSRVLSWILGELGVRRVVALGSALEGELAEVLRAQISGELANACGKLSILAAAAVLERAWLFVTNDGGLLHLAKAVRTPTLSFFGPTDPRAYGPYPRTALDWVIVHGSLPCRPCYVNFRYNADCPDRACLQELTAQDVIASLEAQDFLARMLEQREMAAVAR